VGSSCEFVIEPSGSIKCWETIEWLHSRWAYRVLLNSIELVSKNYPIEYKGFLIVLISS
jgi:hypothetical protein